MKLTDIKQENIAILKNKIKSNPEDPKIYLQLANEYKGLNYYDSVVYCYKALEYLKNEIKNGSTSADKYNLMGLCLEGAHHPQQAITYYKKAISFNPKKAVYYYNLGHAENKASDYNNSMKDMEYAIKLDPFNPYSYDQLGVISANLKKYVQAIRNEKCGINVNNNKNNPIISRCYFHMAYDENELKHYTTGIDCMEHAINSIPPDSQVPNSYKPLLDTLVDNNDNTQNESNDADNSDESEDSNADNSNKYKHGYNLSYNPHINYIGELNNLIGLGRVKFAIKTLIKQVEMNEIRTGERAYNRVHLVFEGEPGTGKTTVAKLLCRVLYQEHIISQKKFTCVNATQLIYSHYGSSSRNVREVIKESIGGVLFIDEAYYLAHRKDGNSVCQDEAMDALLTAIDKHNNDLVIIMAGYTKQMEHFLNKSNPGLQSRFPEDDRIVFPDYSCNECLQILYYFLNEHGYKINDPKTKSLLSKYMNKYILTKRNDSRNIFANARTVKNIYERLIKVQIVRLFNNYSKSQMLTNKEVTNEITVADVKNTFECFSLSKYHNAANELNSLIGLKNVKTLIHNYINLKRIVRLRHGNTNSIGMDLIFEGNPGTGKTTVAKIFCKLLYQKGLVKSNNYVYLSASMLQSSKVGQSAKNLRKAFYRAKSGVLFIDEAYALLNSKDDDDLLSELVADITKYKNSVVVILAGYPKAMKNLLKYGNAGLKSRFDYCISFDNYSDKECLQILYYGLHKDSLIIDSKASKRLLKNGFMHFIKYEKSNKQYKFSNARTVNKFLKYLKQNFANRLSNSSSSWLKTLKLLHDSKLNTITSEDINNTLKQCQKLYNNKPVKHCIGFR